VDKRRSLAIGSSTRHTSFYREDHKVEQEEKRRERSFIREIVPDWRPTREQKLWTTRIVIMLVAVLGVLTLIGLPFDITLWNWMDLLIIPVVLAIGGYLFTRSENRATRVAAEQRAQDDALQAYLDQMSAMLIPTNQDQPSLYKARPGDSLSSVARARTLTVLPRLDADRKARVVQFLYESGLIAKDRPILDLRGANLMGADLSMADLSWAELSGAYLSGAIGWTEEQLLAAYSLEGTTMPDGQVFKSDDNPKGPTFEDWLKSRSRGEDGENSGPS
jgi:hypothetical protein